MKRAQFLLLSILFIIPLVMSPKPAMATQQVKTWNLSAPIEGDDPFAAKTAQFEQILEAIRSQLKIPGMSAAIVKEQELAWAQGFGFADLETGRKAAPDTPYYLASLTKPFASTILLQLVEQEQIDLDDPISQYGLRINSPGEIRIRHLLSHTSEGVPGGYYQYQGFRYGYLAQVIKRASGQSFAELLIDKILNPLSMGDSVPHSELEGPEYQHIAARLTRPYALDSAYQVVPGVYEDHFSTSVGLISTVLDMAKYDIALDRNQLIAEETREMAFTPVTLTSGEQSPYGLGWFAQSFQGMKLVWHYGYNPPSFSTLVLKVPERELTLIIFANTDSLSRPFGLGQGNVMNSPVAIVFIKLFVMGLDAAGDIPWDGKAEEIISQLRAAQAAGHGELAKQELLSRYLTARFLNNDKVAERLMQVYATVFVNQDSMPFKTLPLIVNIEDVGNHAYQILEFSLDRDTRVQVYASGEYSASKFWDLGGIEDVSRGELIWTMTRDQTVPAGGAFKNRLAAPQISLAKGTYRLHYRSDGSHAYGNWNDLPPDDLFWGIALYDVAGTSIVRTVREIEITNANRLLDSTDRPLVSQVENLMLWASAILFLSAILAWPLARFWGRFLAAQGNKPINRQRAASLARWLAGTNALFFLVFTLPLVLIFGLEFFVLHGLAPDSTTYAWEKALMYIPNINVLLTAGQLMVAGIAWRKKWWSLPGRIHFSIVTAAAINYLFLLNHWTLIVPLV